MKALLLLCLLATTASARARSRELAEAASPDGRFTVQVVETATPRRLWYQLISRRTGALLHRSLSSYQPEEPGEAWAWNHALEADVAWSPDSRFVALDEQVHRYEGRVLLLQVGARTRALPLPERTLLLRTGGRWDRSRLRLHRGWLSARELSLVLSGQVITNEEPDGRRTCRSLRYFLVLHLRPGRATLEKLAGPEEA